MRGSDDSLSPAHRLLREEQLPLASVPGLVPDTPIRRGFNPFSSVPEGWGSYYQSMARKAASTQHNTFQFDENGAFAPPDPEEARASLCGWLGARVHEEEIARWLKNGTPPSRALFGAIRRRLEAEMLVDTDLYGRPICRLVQADQLRYDPDYAAVYQLTPAQVRLISRQREPAGGDGTNQPTLAGIRDDQRMYWRISEIFQSAIALFDSDLGRDRTSGNSTRNLLHIYKSRRAPGAPMAPAELNLYSPLRFWSPPPAFARYVFHMLFWQPMVTGRDLYNRPFPRTVTRRLRSFRVAINTYNASKYRIANYAGLLRLVEALTYAIRDHGGGNPDTPLADLDDLVLKKEVFYPHRFRHLHVVTPAAGRVHVPLGSLGVEAWELASRYSAPGEPTRVEHLYKMLRDRVLEIILWSKYQMEIRSVGMVPIQRVYQVKLTRAGFRFVRRMQALHGAGRLDALDQEFSDAVFSGTLETYVVLRKEYDRDLERQLRPGNEIKWFNAPTEENDDDA